MHDTTPSWGVDPVPERLHYLLGSFFVPLFGVLVADWLAERAHYTPAHVFNDTEWRPAALLSWLVGFALYQWLSPVGPAWWTRLVAHTHPQSVSFTASLPSFAAAFALTLPLKSAFGVARRRRTALA
jgi:nucleobase:cation symporter-1, NCS1 family